MQKTQLSSYKIYRGVVKKYDQNGVYPKYRDKAAEVSVMHHMRSQRKMTTCFSIQHLATY